MFLKNKLQKLTKTLIGFVIIVVSWIQMTMILVFFAEHPEQQKIWTTSKIRKSKEKQKKLRMRTTPLHILALLGITLLNLSLPVITLVKSNLHFPAFQVPLQKLGNLCWLFFWLLLVSSVSFGLFVQKNMILLLMNFRGNVVLM